ncbi:MAG: hypothetical protein HUK03_10705 [Bacteroidaceae bacterium]|nr:hypothetical protein [Bacteroidaceae bacterium]
MKKRWSGTLSGLTNSIFASSHACSENATEQTASVPMQQTGNTLKGSIRTFGRFSNSNSGSKANKLRLAVVKDNQKVDYYTFDVTDQIVKASDPRNVDIVVVMDSAQPTQPDDPDHQGDDNPAEEKGGMDADVDEFGNENIEIKA